MEEEKAGAAKPPKFKEIPVYWEFSYGTVEIPDLQSDKSASSGASSDDE